jgi:hypothetical protein
VQAVLQDDETVQAELQDDESREIQRLKTLLQQLKEEVREIEDKIELEQAIQHNDKGELVKQLKKKQAVLTKKQNRLDKLNADGVVVGRKVKEVEDLTREITNLTPIINELTIQIKGIETQESKINSYTRKKKDRKKEKKTVKNQLIQLNGANLSISPVSIDSGEPDAAVSSKAAVSSSNAAVSSSNAAVSSPVSSPKTLLSKSNPLGQTDSRAAAVAYDNTYDEIKNSYDMRISNGEKKSNVKKSLKRGYPDYHSFINRLG